MFKNTQSNTAYAYEVKVTQSCLILCDIMDCPSVSSDHGILQASMLEWATIPFSTCNLESTQKKKKQKIRHFQESQRELLLS